MSLGDTGKTSLNGQRLYLQVNNRCQLILYYTISNPIPRVVPSNYHQSLLPTSGNQNDPEHFHGAQSFYICVTYCRTIRRCPNGSSCKNSQSLATFQELNMNEEGG